MDLWPLFLSRFVPICHKSPEKDYDFSDAVIDVLQAVMGVYSQVNANLKAHTIEMLLEHKKQMHISAFEYRINEIEDILKASSLKTVFSNLTPKICFFTVLDFAGL